MTFRSKKLLATAQYAPHCMSCGVPNHGQVVAAHSNRQSHGKGTGHKASDAASCFVCDRCHDAIDGRIGGLSREARQEMHADAYYKTMIWLFETGRAVVA